MDAAHFIQKYMDTAANKMFQQFFSSYSDKMFARVSTHNRALLLVLPKTGSTNISETLCCSISIIVLSVYSYYDTARSVSCHGVEYFIRRRIPRTTSTLCCVVSCTWQCSRRKRWNSRRPSTRVLSLASAMPREWQEMILPRPFPKKQKYSESARSSTRRLYSKLSWR